jgi:signal transduction histidine kinase
VLEPPVPTELARDVSARLRLERALRRVATLAAQGADPQRLFSVLAEQDVAPLLGLFAFSLLAYDVGAGTLTKVAGSTGPNAGMPRGTQFRVQDYPLTGAIIETGRPARDDSRTRPAAKRAPYTAGQSVGAPVKVDGDIWGVIAGLSDQTEVLEPMCEEWLADLAALMAIAIENARRRDDLADLAESQGALRRVATLVAQDGDPQTVFAEVAFEAARILGVGAVSLIRWDAHTQLFTKIFGTHGERAAVVDGGTWPMDECPEGELILKTGRPVRIDDWASLPGPVVALHLERGFGQGVAAPVVLDGAIWGHIAAFGEAGDILAPGAELKLADFTRLMATAIANAQTRAELRGLAAEQGAALRRVATLVSERALPSTVFDAVALEAARALKVRRVDVGRCHDDGSVSLLGSTSPAAVTDNRRFAASGLYVTRRVMALGSAARIDDWTGLSARESSVAVGDGFASVVGAPIWIDGSVWGVIAVLSDAALAEDTETRLTDFTHLVASLIANVQARDDLIASRARIVAASDEARRRIERNLHDGIQQRLVSVALSLREVRGRSSVPSGIRSGLEDVARELEGVLEEIQVFSQGLHPALLSRSGLGPSLKELVRRSPIIVDLDVVGPRLPEPVETAVYYFVCEALANTTKHGMASEVSITVACAGDSVHVMVGDNGIGGAAVGAGSGLTGLVDRVEALGGRLILESPPGRGTRISAELPIAPPASKELSTW